MLRHSRNSSHFMEPEGSLPHLQQPVICPYPEPDRSTSRPPFHLSKIHSNIILLSTFWSSKWSPFLIFPHYNSVRTSLHHTCYMSCPSQSSWLRDFFECSNSVHSNWIFAHFRTQILSQLKLFYASAIYNLPTV